MRRRMQRNRLRSRVRDSRGQAAVEFVLSILFVLVLIFGIMELVMMVYTFTVVADSAKEGVRFAIVHGCNNTECYGPGACTNLVGGTPVTCDASATGIVNRVRQYAQYSLHDIAGMNITVTYGPATGLTSPDTSMPGSAVKVDVQYPYVPYFSFGWRPTLHASATGSIFN